MSDKSSQLATLSANIKQGIENRLKELHTSMPGIIQSFDAVSQTASVQPAVKRIFKTTEEDVEILTPVDLPILINVPVHFPRGGGYSMTFPVKKGDECLLEFCERSIDNWYRTGEVKEPLDRRFHSLSDATATVGLSSKPNAVPNYSTTSVQIKKDDGNASFSIKDDNGIRMENSSGFVELQADGKFNINGVIFDTHFHDQPNDSGGNSEQPTGGPQS
jgi:hypothetical protein